MLRTLLVLGVLVGCATKPATTEPDAPTSDAADPPRTGATPVDPSWRCGAELMPGDNLCCRLFCEDPKQFRLTCAHPGTCINFYCPTTDGTRISPELCTP